MFTLNIVYKFMCGRWNATYYGKTCRHFEVKVSEHSDISPLTNKRFKSKKSTAVKNYMLICDQPVSFDDFKVLASSNSSSIWKSRKVNLFWIKMKHLCHYICLISYTNILQSYDYLVSPFIHCYLLFIASVTKYILKWALNLY